jgi:hypothetical protein
VTTCHVRAAAIGVPTSRCAPHDGHERYVRVRPPTEEGFCSLRGSTTRRQVAEDLLDSLRCATRANAPDAARAGARSCPIVRMSARLSTSRITKTGCPSARARGTDPGIRVRCATGARSSPSMRASRPRHRSTVAQCGAAQHRPYGELADQGADGGDELSGDRHPKRIDRIVHRERIVRLYDERRGQAPRRRVCRRPIEGRG